MGVSVFFIGNKRDGKQVSDWISSHCGLSKHFLLLHTNTHTDHNKVMQTVSFFCFLSFFVCFFYFDETNTHIFSLLYWNLECFIATVPLFFWGSACLLLRFLFFFRNRVITKFGNKISKGTKQQITRQQVSRIPFSSSPFHFRLRFLFPCCSLVICAHLCFPDRKMHKLGEMGR